MTDEATPSSESAAAPRLALYTYDGFGDLVVEVDGQREVFRAGRDYELADDHPAVKHMRERT